MEAYYVLRDGSPEFTFYTDFNTNRIGRFFFLCRAADNGNAEARYELGRLYEFGDEDVSIDVVKALMWYRLSTKGGNDKALEDIDRLSRAVSPSQLKQVEAMTNTRKFRDCEIELYESKRDENQGL